jgi:small subunit ribosomal protein S8e
MISINLFDSILPCSIHLVRSRGGNTKFRAIRLEEGTYSWGSQAISKKTRIVDVVYNASNNELVRTKTLVKNSIVAIDSSPFKTWFETHYHQKIGHEKGSEAGFTLHDAAATGKQSKSLLKKIAERKADMAADPKVLEQFASGRVLACISSRPGQSGRVDGYILEGPELDFYSRKLALKKSGKAK